MISKYLRNQVAVEMLDEVPASSEFGLRIVETARTRLKNAGILQGPEGRLAALPGALLARYPTCGLKSMGRQSPREAYRCIAAGRQPRVAAMASACGVSAWP
jgi:hypothetical protein